VETVRWAMTDILRKPPPAFENVIRRHFWLKSDEICEQVEQWISELQEKGHETYLQRLKVETPFNRIFDVSSLVSLRGPEEGVP
jgi:hypothetical protein